LNRIARAALVTPLGSRAAAGPASALAERAAHGGEI